MNDLLILGTDTDVGKSTFALLWLLRFGEAYEYWKPVETGESDSKLIERLVDSAVVHPPIRRFQTPVAPPLAARMEGGVIPAPRTLADLKPTPTHVERSLLIESFGSPFSPLTDDVLQLEWIRALGGSSLLVSSARLGAVGRTLQCLTALGAEGITPKAVILMGPRDRYAEQTIEQHCPELAVIAVEPPSEWTQSSLRACADAHANEFERVRCRLVNKAIAPQNIVADDRRAVWHPYTPLVGADDPLVCVSARDEFLELADGRRVIDGISSWWTILHGHRHAPLMQALADGAAQLDHVHFAGVTHPAAVELADLLLGTMPWAAGRVFYSDNGSTAVEVALKIAYQHWCHRGETERTGFIGFEHGYHGDTFGAMAVSRDPVFFGRFEPLLFHADILPLDPARLDAHLAEHANRTAGVILEPLVQGAGGMCMHSPEMLRMLAEITHRHGVLFIADEVMTGGGRTGTLWAHQAAGIAPDLLCAAKTLTGGILPLAVTLVSPELVASFRSADRSRTLFHGHSFTANPLACAVAVRNMRALISTTPDAPARFERHWSEALQPIRSLPRVKDVRVRGIIAAVELDVPGGYLADVGARMRRICLEHGVLLRPLGNVLYALPPYCTSAASLDCIAQAMHAAVMDV